MPHRGSGASRVTTRCIGIVLAGLAGSGFVLGVPAGESVNRPVASSSLQAPDTPAQRLNADGTPRAAFLRSHEKFLRTGKENQIDLLFLGDSITAGWRGHRTLWDTSFGMWRPANFGNSGDRTQHLLWRISNGELDSAKPKVIVVLIGTNNAASDTPEAIASGITKIVQVIRAKLPQTKLLLLAIFPRGEKPNPMREKLTRVNELISRLVDGATVHYLDIGHRFLDVNGVLRKEIMPDFLHLSLAGYQIWADAIRPKLEQLLESPDSATERVPSSGVDPLWLLPRESGAPLSDIRCSSADRSADSLPIAPAGPLREGCPRGEPAAPQTHPSSPSNPAAVIR